MKKDISQIGLHTLEIPTSQVVRSLVKNVTDFGSNLHKTLQNQID